MLESTASDSRILISVNDCDEGFAELSGVATSLSGSAATSAVSSAPRLCTVVASPRSPPESVSPEVSAASVSALSAVCAYSTFSELLVLEIKR